MPSVIMLIVKGNYIIAKDYCDYFDFSLKKNGGFVICLANILS
jgi:hypothetical protein